MHKRDKETIGDRIDRRFHDQKPSTAYSSTPGLSRWFIQQLFVKRKKK